MDEACIVHDGDAAVGPTAADQVHVPTPSLFDVSTAPRADGTTDAAATIALMPASALRSPAGPVTNLDKFHIEPKTPPMSNLRPEPQLVRNRGITESGV